MISLYSSFSNAGLNTKWLFSQSWEIEILESNPSLLHCRLILYHLSHQGSLESIRNEVQFLSFSPQLKLSSFSFNTRRKVSSLSLHLRKELEVEMSKEELNGSDTVPSLPPRRHFFLVAGATRKQVM